MHFNRLYRDFGFKRVLVLIFFSGNLPQLEHEIYGDAAEEDFSFGYLSDFELSWKI